MTIRFGEYKKRDISFLLNFVTNPFLYYTGYRWWTVNANFFRNNEEIHLTQLEYRLLMALLAQPGRVLTHRQLLNTVWGPSYVEQTQYIRIYMGHLRQKLEQDATQPRYLQTETGIGYRFILD